MNQPSDARKPSMISAAVAPPRRPERPEVGDDVGHGDHGVEHRDVDVLARAGGVAVPERGQHADHRVEPGPDVAQRADGRHERRVVAAALELVDARHRLDDRRERRPRVVGRRHGVPEAGHREVDGARGAPPRCRRSRARGDAMAPAFEFSAITSNRGRQAQHEVASGRRLEVDRDGALAEVVAQEGRARRCAPRGRPSPAASRGRGRRPAGSPPSPRRRRAGPSSWVA